MLEEVTKIQIEPYGDTVPGLPGVLEQVRIQFNDDFGQFFYLRNNASTALLLERIARMCLSAWVDEHRDRKRRCATLAIREEQAVAETRKLAAILVSDVVGYSRLAGSDEDRTLARLRALRSDLIDPIIAVHNGRVVKRHR